MTTVKLRVMIAGATGWVGRALSAAVIAAPDLELVAAVSRTRAGEPLGKALGRDDVDLIVTGTVAEGLAARPDVMVEYTSATAARENVLAAIDAGVPVVLGSSGVTASDFAEIDRRAREKNVGVIAAGNFALTGVLLQRFAAEAARHLDQWEIIDYSDASKPDAPSGTTRELAHRLSQVKKPKPTIPIDETLGPVDSRGTNMEGTQIHSVRVPGFILSAEVIFGATDERLTIRYDAGSGPEPYIGGTLLAVRKVGLQLGLVRGLDAILEE